MEDRESQIRKIVEVIEDTIVDYRLNDPYETAQALYDNGYRNMRDMPILTLAEKEKIKKQVAQEILQDWYNDVVHGMGVDGCYIKEYAKKYGVDLEVD